jgi:4-hydroxyphenylpyruvate dioxygenase
MVRDHGLEITLFQPFRDFEGMPEPHRSRTFDRAERKFDIMQQLGTDLVLVCSNVSPVSLGGIDRAAADFHELGERAAKRGLRVGYEALAWGRHINDHRDAWEIVRRADHPNIGLSSTASHACAQDRYQFDPLHPQGEDIHRPTRRCTADRHGPALLEPAFSQHAGRGRPPGHGVHRGVAETGYDGYFSLEIFNDQFRGGSAAIAADGHRSLIYLGDQVRRDPASDKRPDAGSGHAGAHPSTGVGFVEFSADEEDAAELTASAAHPWASAGPRHRTKKGRSLRAG